MNANELRIGNLIQKNDEICEVSSIHSDSTIRIFNDDKTDTFGCFALRIFNPIPLTEEWLLKLGFTKDNYGCFYLSRIDENENNLWLKTQENNIGVALNMFHLERKETYLNNVEFVHQLQNLYFALTAKELVVSDAVS
jgi:hypothetical protein